MVLTKLGIVIIDLECRGEGDCLKPELTTEGFLVLSLHFFYRQSTSNCNCGHDFEYNA